MTHPNLLRVTRWCAKWAGGVLLVATLSLLAAARPHGGLAFAPLQVTDLRISAATDSALVLTWTEVYNGGSGGMVRYLVRYGGFVDFTWTASPNVVTGGCATPVYGSTTSGGRTRSCVLSGLTPNRMYGVQLVSYTGVLTSSTVVFGPLSNVVQGRTAQRVGPMIVSRPPAVRDTIAIAAVEVSDWPNVRFPLRGNFWLGDRRATFYDSSGGITALGYLVIVQP